MYTREWYCVFMMKKLNELFYVIVEYLLQLNWQAWLYQVTDIGCVYHHTSDVELRFPNDFQGDFCR